MPVAAAMAAARKVYEQNSAQRGPVIADAIAFQSADEETAVVAVGSATMPTRLLRLAGITSLPLVGSDAGKAVRTVGVNAVQSLETSLVVGTPARLDADGLSGLIEGARAFVDMIVWEERNGHASTLALVPYASGVALGALSSAVSSVTAPRVMFRVLGGQRLRMLQTDCVAERSGPDLATDASPATAPLSIVFSATGLCDSRVPVVLPSTDKSLLWAAMAGLRSGGAAAGHLGLAWGSYLLSPRWANALPWPLRAPAPYADTVPPAPNQPARVRKSAVVVADGLFDTQFCDSSGSSIGMVTVLADAASPQSTTPNGDCLSPNGASARQAAMLCAGMKAAGVSLFTLAYPANGGDVAALRDCASDQQSFYVARNAMELLNAFRDITLKLTTMLMTR